MADESYQSAASVIRRQGAHSKKWLNYMKGFNEVLIKKSPIG
jgi:hypothetical protein